MGQSGVLESDRLMFDDSPSSTEKIEVVMGRCFPLSGPGGGYDVSMPVVRKIVYKNRDGATFTQTFSEVISSENNNYRVPITDNEQILQGEKQDCRKKSAPYVKPEASDGTRADSIIASVPRSHTQAAVNREWQGKIKPLNHTDHLPKKQAVPAAIGSEDIKRISEANSPRFKVKNKKETPKVSELSGKEAWEETQKKKAQLRDEFFKVPYEECNSEALHRMGGRLNKSEPKLNAAAKERKKRNSLSDKRRVHFNMDDSQLEDIRKWREERRMQATPQVIKTVARIYSLDNPSNNQRQIEYINSFDSPTAEVPIAVSVQDSPPSRTKTARPTDLDSLQSQFSSVGNQNGKNYDTNSRLKRGSILKTTEACENMTWQSNQRKTAPETNCVPANVNETIDRETSSRTSRNPISQTQNYKPILRRPTEIGGASTTLVPSISSSGRTVHSSPGTKTTASFGDGSISQVPDYLRTDSSRGQPQIHPRTSYPPKIIDSSKEQTSVHNSKLTSHTPQHPSMHHSSPDTNVMQRLHQQSEQQNQKPQTKPIDKNILNASVRPKDFHPHVLHPVPLPRSKSLSVKEGPSSQDTTSESQNIAPASVRTKTYASRRATSLDRAFVRKRDPELALEPSYSLKSPGLILNHLRSPTPTSLTNKTPANNVIQNREKATPSHTISPMPQEYSSSSFHSVTPTSQEYLSPIQNHQLSSSRPASARFISNDNRLSDYNLVNLPQNLVNRPIIRSYTYPKRNSVTVLQKIPHQNSENTVSRGTEQDYHTHQVQHPKFPSKISHIPNNDLNNKSSQFNNTSQQFETLSTPTNRRVTHNNNTSQQFETSSTSNRRASHNNNTSQQFETSSTSNRRATHNNNTSQQFETSSTSNRRASHNNNSSQQFETATTNRRVTHKPSNKENENEYLKKTIQNGKGNSVNILMTKGESYAKHRIVLNSHDISTTPKVTVTKFIVPSSTTSVPVRSAPSPTPSCASSSCSFGSSGSSSGCFSGSPSPTPTPSPTRVRSSGVPTDL